MSTATVPPDEQTVSTDKLTPPPRVKKRVDRGRQAIKKNAVERRLYYRFWRGDSYAYVNGKGALNSLSTVPLAAGGTKPNHRIRGKHPFIAMLIGAKVSAATQKVPSYEIVPSTTEPEDAYAATLAEKVALYGYDKWRVKRATTKVVEHALVGGEGFAMPYFDASVGPFVETFNEQTGQIERIGQGEIATKIFSANEVGWEPGSDFEESRWHFTEQAMPIDVVKEMPGFFEGLTLAADTTTAEAPRDTSKGDQVLVTTYLERPSAKNPDGLKLVMANGKRIVPDEDYPCLNAKGEVLDEPVLLRLSYIVESEDRDRGLVELLVDLQRTVDDCWNKLKEWKNRCLNPQMIAPRGSDMARRDDTPGAVWYYRAVGAQKPEWERPPAIPRELFDLLDKALEHMRALAADVDVQPDPRLTSQTAQQAIEQAQLRWQTFLADLAEFHSRLMRRYLYLVQRHYTESRLVKIQGLFGPDLTPGFRGADLLGEADVRVSPDSLAAKSRQSVIQETLLFADRGWISPQAAMAVIQGGTAENLWKSWLLDVGRANKIIQTLKQGPQALFSLPDRPVYPGEDVPPGQETVPGYMPRPFDNVAVWKEVFEAWMKTADFDSLDPGMQHAAMTVYQALLSLQATQQAEAAAQQQAVAEQLGMNNAAKPQTGPQLPSQPQLQGPQGANAQGANNGQAQ